MAAPRHITKNGKEVWQITYKDADGKRHQPIFRTREEADAAYVKFKGDVRDGTYIDPNKPTTVANACDLWIEAKRIKVLPATQLGYEQHVNLHIKPAIGMVKLAQLNESRVEHFYNQLVQRKSATLANKVLTSLVSILKAAQRKKLVAQNVALGTERVKPNDAELEEAHDFPTKDEINRIIKHATGKRHPLFVTAIFTGMRASELRALTWDNVDLVKKEIHVRKRADRWANVGQPKSRAGRRKIPMMFPMLLSVLREWKLACPPSKLNLVFPNRRGLIENHSNLNNAFAIIQKRGSIVNADGEAKYSLHALRHFYAAMIIEQGYTPKRCQALLGHSSITMTFDRYGYLFDSSEDDHARGAAAERALLNAV